MTQRYRVVKVEKDGIIELEPIEEKPPEEKLRNWLTEKFETGFINWCSYDREKIIRELIEAGLDAEKLK